MVSLLASVYKNFPGISMVVTSLPTLAATPLVLYIDSTATVGDDFSFLDLYTRCGFPYAHPLALIFPLVFILKNIRYAGAFRLTSAKMAQQK